MHRKLFSAHSRFGNAFQFHIVCGVVFNIDIKETSIALSMPTCKVKGSTHPDQKMPLDGPRLKLCCKTNYHARTHRSEERFPDATSQVMEHVDSLLGQGEIGSTLPFIGGQLPQPRLLVILLKKENQLCYGQTFMFG